MPSPMEILLDPLSFIVMGIFISLIFWEALFPARPLPKVAFWKTKGLIGFVSYMLVSTYLPLLWDGFLAQFQFWSINHWALPMQVVVGFLVYESMHYIWHRSMHASDFLWQHIHQMHHSAERLDSFGAFWLSPLDMAGFTLVGSAALVLVIGVSPEAATIILLALVFCAVFQHLNIRTPQWLGYLIQRPESHSHHHGKGIHRDNYADVPWFDLLLGTFHNPISHSENGFYQGATNRIVEMLFGRDVSEPKKPDTLIAAKETL
ncbi:MAG: fatty acid hydroxylase [Pseudomonadales bacterium]|nr:fatty acid hydroxylase [Pseudomonadales bacterium]